MPPPVSRQAPRSPPGPGRPPRRKVVARPGATKFTPEAGQRPAAHDCRFAGGRGGGLCQFPVLARDRVGHPARHASILLGRGRLAQPDRGLAAVLHDLLREPLELLASTGVQGKRNHPVRHLHDAQTTHLTPHGDPRRRGFTREAVRQQHPAGSAVHGRHDTRKCNHGYTAPHEHPERQISRPPGHLLRPAVRASQPAGTNAAEATIGALCRYFLRLGALGFGGPVALAGYMQRDLVEERGWISPQEYRDGLAIAQMAPGPLAAQLAMWLAFVRTGVRGATLASFAFVGPPFLFVVVIGWFYVALGSTRWVGSLFHGIAPAAIAIIALSAYRLLPITIGRDRLLWSIAISVGLLTYFTQSEIALAFLRRGIPP